MRLNRFFLEFNFNDKEIIIKNNDFINQVRSVLRMDLGDKLILCDGTSNEVLAKIISFGKNEIILENLEIMENKNEPARKVTLYCSILKKENFELVVQKAVEVGVYKIVPVISIRTVKTNIRPDRLNKIIKEAAEQSGRGIVPELTEAINFKDALNLCKNNDRNVLFDASGHNFKESEDSISHTLGIFVGPEGGWDDLEIDMARSTGLDIVSLGPLILRAETAAVVATYLAVMLK
jgi:16S rRNA (uracil1498-N3)-methyltransferase